MFSRWGDGQPYPPALSQSWERGRLWRIYPPPRREGWHSRNRQSRASRRKRRCYAPLTDCSCLCLIVGGDGGYTTRALCKNARGQRLLWDILSRSHCMIILTFRVEWPGGVLGAALITKIGRPPVGPGYIAQKSRPIFKDDFLRNVIVSIYFLVFSSKFFRFRVPNKS